MKRSIEELLTWRFKLWQASYHNTPTADELVKSINGMMYMDEPYELYDQFRAFRKLRQDQRSICAQKVVAELTRL